MTVLATCTDCGSTHGLSARQYDGMNTVCPQCESSRYVTESDAPTVDADEIRAVLEQTDGVGDSTLENIQAAVGTLTLVPTLSVDRLTDIENVGQQTAKNIVRQF